MMQYLPGRRLHAIRYNTGYSYGFFTLPGRDSEHIRKLVKRMYTWLNLYSLIAEKLTCGVGNNSTLLARK